MGLPIQIENAYQRIVDRIYDHLPRPMPSVDRLKRCKIISHRGEHSANPLEENTITAFDKAALAGVWGIELDVRWTQDWVPVVAHDEDLVRLHGEHYQLNQIPLPELKAQYPAIPTLDEVISRFGQQLHLMIEIKQDPQIGISQKGDILAEVLRPLAAETDYHLMALDPQTLVDLPQISPRAKVPIAYHFPGRFSQWVAQQRWGGLCGHYLMMRRTIVAKHQNLGQQVGTGFADSANILLRELNRGIDWIFSNNAAQLQTFINASLKKAL